MIHTSVFAPYYVILYISKKRKWLLKLFYISRKESVYC